MAQRPSAKKPDASTSTVDLRAIVPDERPPDNDLVEVRWHDGGTQSSTLYHGKDVVSFIDGVAYVPVDVAKRLRAGGYVK